MKIKSVFSLKKWKRLFLGSLLARCVPDKRYLKMLARNKGMSMDIDNPKTYNEKLQWLKLHDRRPEYARMVDKHEAKAYVAERIGAEYIIPTLGVWDQFDDIDFDALPERFVLKCTHDSGGLCICKDKSKIDKDKLRKVINKSLKTNYFWHGREWPYKYVKPRIIAEQYMEDENGVLNDYKLQCFGGKFDSIFVCVGRHTSEGVKYHYFDKNWNYLPYSVYEGLDVDSLKKYRPASLDKMIELAELLSEGIPQLRVDFYEINGKIYFGELTFFSQSGFDQGITEEADKILGSRLDLTKLLGKTN